MGGVSGHAGSHLPAAGLAAGGHARSRCAASATPWPARGPSPASGDDIDQSRNLAKTVTVE
jgi:hypothetical protein